MKRPQPSRTRQVTLAAVFSAVYVILRLLPTFSMVGVSAQFTTGDFLLTTIATIAGLWSGMVAVLVGTVLAYAVRPPIFFGLDFLPAVVNVSIVGSILAGKPRAAQGIFFAVLVLFLLSPYSLLYGYDHVPYVWLHILALALLLSPVTSRIPSWIKRGSYWEIAGFGVLAFVGTMAQHLTGGLLFEFTLGFIGGMSPAGFTSIWRLIFYLYPEERLIIVAISTFLAVAIYRSLQKWAPPSWRS